jgi:hypothetical protein
MNSRTAEPDWPERWSCRPWRSVWSVRGVLLVLNRPTPQLAQDTSAWGTANASFIIIILLLASAFDFALVGALW